VNGDGLVDVIRLEHISEGLGATYPLWTGTDLTDFECRATEHLDFQVRVWLNTGRGFALDPSTALTFYGIEPWYAMRRFDMMTVAAWNADGRADLIAPDFGHSGWIVHLAQPLGFIDEELAIDVPWDHAHVWDWNGSDVPTRVLAIRTGDTPTMSDLVA